MFTGIIEGVGKVRKIDCEKSNLLITVQCDFAHELSINQSVSHNGVCLSITDLGRDNYTVCAINETLQKTNLKLLRVGDEVNLERCLIAGSRIDGHIVQGHIDCKSQLINKEDVNGSWILTFKYHPKHASYLVPKGSIAINGISLTLTNIDSKSHFFSVAIIPYTYQNTNIKSLKNADWVNIEYDTISKQIAHLHSTYEE